ncbi:hypothetical protein MKK68_18695 [Methylobacterium sp. E-016]|uniref:hypothetical protein n=1 Tax=Methylobacterium sp. E-016 TaxID=2836556 RepID=UPI001FB9F975|nr:hypothetical protein [Methylobacterium sp. E-016]MCJ2077652.1 hypothetical protein [Methylobacterium sp. E-016]
MSDHSSVFVWISPKEDEASTCLAELTSAWPDIASETESLQASTKTAIGILEGLVAAGVFSRIEEANWDDWDFETELRLANTAVARTD